MPCHVAVRASGKISALHARLKGAQVSTGAALRKLNDNKGEGGRIVDSQGVLA